MKKKRVHTLKKGTVVRSVVYEKAAAESQSLVYISLCHSAKYYLWHHKLVTKETISETVKQKMDL